MYLVLSYCPLLDPTLHLGGQGVEAWGIGVSLGVTYGTDRWGGTDGGMIVELIIGGISTGSEDDKPEVGDYIDKDSGLAMWLVTVGGKTIFWHAI